MAITFDPAKRDKTLIERELDFADAERVFAGLTETLPDDRHDYGEPRWQTYGLLGERDYVGRLGLAGHVPPLGLV